MLQKWFWEGLGLHLGGVWACLGRLVGALGGFWAAAAAAAASAAAVTQGFPTAFLSGVVGQRLRNVVGNFLGRVKYSETALQKANS